MVVTPNRRTWVMAFLSLEEEGNWTSKPPRDYSYKDIYRQVQILFLNLPVYMAAHFLVNCAGSLPTEREGRGDCPIMQTLKYLDKCMDAVLNDEEHYSITQNLPALPPWWAVDLPLDLSATPLQDPLPGYPGTGELLHEWHQVPSEREEQRRRTSSPRREGHDRGRSRNDLRSRADSEPDRRRQTSQTPRPILITRGGFDTKTFWEFMAQLLVTFDPSTNDNRLEHFENNLLPALNVDCLLYTSPSPRDATLSRMPSSA